MPAIALLNDEKEMLGFMLVSPDEPFTPNSVYDCILMGFPKKAELADSPLCDVIQKHKNTEFTLQVSGEPQTFSVDLADGWVLQLSIGSEGVGTWCARHSDGTILPGHCELAKKGNG